MNSKVIQNIFIRNFESLRKQAGISRQKVFDEIGLSRTQFVNWKKQNSLPCAETIFLIAKYFDVSMEDLITNEDIQIEKYTTYRQTIIKEIIENLDLLKSKIGELK